MVITLLSLPLFVTAALNLIMGSFYFFLYGRLLIVAKLEKRSYLIFGLLNLAACSYLASYAIMLNSPSNLGQLFFFNYGAVWSAQLAVILSLHLIKVYFQDRFKLDVFILYGVAGAFVVVSFFWPDIFLKKAFFQTTSYFTGLELGPLFSAWSFFILTVFAYMVGYLVYRIIAQWTDRNQRKTLFFLLTSTLLWSILGILEALSVIQVLDIPPLSWIGSVLIIMAFSVLLVRQIEGLYIDISNLYHQVIHDTLTGVYSRRYMEVKLNELLAGLKRQDRTLYLGILDVDNFKHINDNFGHLVGDEVLKAVTQTLKNRLRPTDEVGRYGGDEFVFILNEVRENQDVFVIVDRIREEVARLTFNENGQRFGVSCSFGATSFNQGAAAAGFQLSDLVAKADEALYLSKLQGKNTINILPLEPPKAL